MPPLLGCPCWLNHTCHPCLLHLFPLCYSLLDRVQVPTLSSNFSIFLMNPISSFQICMWPEQVSPSSIDTLDTQRVKRSLYPDSGHQGRSWPHLFEIFILEHIYFGHMGKVSTLNKDSSTLIMWGK